MRTSDRQISLIQLIACITGVGVLMSLQTILPISLYLLIHGIVLVAAFLSFMASLGERHLPSPLLHIIFVAMIFISLIAGVIHMRGPMDL